MYLIDLCPTFENNKWVIREQLITEFDEVGEVVEEYRFNTEVEADAFIDGWVAKNGK